MSAPSNDDVFKTVGELRMFLENFADDTCLYLRDAGMLCIGLPKDVKVMWACTDQGTDDLVFLTDVHFSTRAQMHEESRP